MSRGVSPLPWIALVPLAALPVGCGSSTPRLNIPSVELAISDSVRAEHHLTVNVDCPPDVEKRAGVAFACRIRLAAGSYQVNAVETDDNGRVRYESRAPLVVLNTYAIEQAIEHSLAGRGRPGARVKCPAPVLQRKDVSFVCRSRTSAQVRRFKVTVVDEAGSVVYKQLL